MTVLSTVSSALIDVLTGQILPAVLTIIGAMLAFSLAVYGLLKVWDYFRGDFQGATFIKLGHSLGAAMHDAEYRKYSSNRDKYERKATHRKRYNRARNP
jgi:prepilin signal peptidase PulO-like enzyme (type II secretory pathway)